MTAAFDDVLPADARLRTVHRRPSEPALLFLIPGLDETLPVNGRAVVTTDPAVLDACAVHDRRPKAAIGVEVSSAYVHCAKALKPGDVWQPERWPHLSGLPSPSCMFADHMALPDLTADAIEGALADDYANRLWS